MNYFVSIENIPYFHWQIELLIESFKQQHLEENLYIAVADNSGVSSYFRNLQEHKNKFLHVNFGPLQNKTRSLLWLLEEGILSKPFTLIHPDMVLCKPVEMEGDLIFNEDFSAITDLKAPLGQFVKDYMIKNNWFSWFPIGDTMVFNETIPTDFFKHVHICLLELIQKFGEVSWNLEKAAWLITLYRYMVDCEQLILAPKNLEQSMLGSDLDTNFIHYKHGLPPHFSKRYYESEVKFGELDPFDGILAVNSTICTDYMCNLIMNYRTKKAYS